MSTLGDRIEKRLKALDCSQSWLAERAGMKQPGIQAIIVGRVERPRKLKEIATALETSQEYLLGETDDPTPPNGAQEKIPPAVREAFEQIPGAPLTEREVRLIVDQLDLIARSRRPHNDDSQNSGQQQAG